MTRIQMRRGTAAEWSSANPVLAAGEGGVETDTGNVRYGDGVTAWADLAVHAPLGVLEPRVEAVEALAPAVGAMDGRLATVETVLPDKVDAADVPSLVEASPAVIAVTPGPGELIVGTASGPVATPVSEIGGGAMGVTNLTATNTAKWRRAVARVRAGTGNAKLLCAGDSTTWGHGTGSIKDRSYPAVLTRSLDRGYAPAQPGLIVPNSTGSPQRDDRWTVPTPWTISPGGVGFRNAFQWLSSTSNPQPLSFTPGHMCDTFVVHYSQNTTTGSISIQVDDGTPVVHATGGTATYWSTVTVTAPLADDHVLTITPTGDKAVGIVGVEAYDSTVPSIHVANAGSSGARADEWVHARSMPVFQNYAPDLTILSLGINDSRQPVAVPTFIGHMRTLGNAAKATGDLILMTTMPTGQSTDTSELQAQYRDALFALADELDCPLIDLYEPFVSYELANSLGMMFDHSHPNELGAAEMAGAVYGAVAR